MNTPTTRTLIFDLSETLVGGLFWMAGPLAQKLGEAEDTVVRSLGGDPLVALVEGRSTEQEYWGAILNLTGWAATQVELASMARDAFRRTVPGMPDLLGELEGYRRVLLSDHAQEWMAEIDRHHPFLEVFDRRFISCEMKRTKRSAETFCYVASQLRTEPRDCVFVDDLQRNVDRAASVGFEAIRFSSADQVRTDLRRLGIDLPG